MLSCSPAVEGKGKKQNLAEGEVELWHSSEQPFLGDSARSAGATVAFWSGPALG